MEEIFLNQFLSIETHISPSDPFCTTETNARAARFGVGGVPNVIFDGCDQHLGTEPCPDLIPIYSDAVNQRLDANGARSPVRITGELAVDGNLARVTAHFELVDPGYSFTAHQATLYLYEDSINWCCGSGSIDLWNGVVRMVRSSPLSLTTVGEVKTVTQTLNMSGFLVPINRANIHPAALFEETGGSKTIIQASDFAPLDYAMEFPARVASVPGGNGFGFFPGRLVNFAENEDVVQLSIDEGFGWPADFQVEGDPNYYQTHEVTLAPGESKEIAVRVLTDSDRRIGSGVMTARSQSTGRVSSEALRLFNGSHSVLLVDDDGGGANEGPFIDAFHVQAYLFESATRVDLRGMRGYDCVVWETGYRAPTLSQTDMDNLSRYLDEGGALFLSSMGYLTGASSTDNFAGAYLGVAGWTNDTAANRVTGTPGDPITDGMDMALDWPSPDSNRVDTIEPTPGARVLLRSEAGFPAGVRFEGPAFRTVLNTVCQDAFPVTGEEPDNGRTVILRTMAWLLDHDPSSLPPSAHAAGSMVLQANPNPARGLVELRFALGPGDAPSVRLSFLDAAGRVVRTLVHTSLKAGFQRTAWDCTDDAGRRVPAGLYFARLETQLGSAATRVLVLH